MYKEGDEVKIVDHLKDSERKKLKQMTGQMKKRKGKSYRGKPPDKKKKEEKVNWVDIMGMNRDTYKRVGGALRRK
ncbi:hypothetical protein [Bacillus sp. V5-8f]|uniref:hypothetical protein n=1 Tax=Bacillus sp. V5-8f TaxID=2053044 RepID=UPI000C77A111|nr:hypothetical protein [Bacillus sp. V5-8f]PLT32874.1 hypothetical protein CUU64_17245 [Bacillus sp. V5-8f]